MLRSALGKEVQELHNAGSFPWQGLHQPNYRLAAFGCREACGGRSALPVLSIAERGTHGELIDRDGLYASMWSRQREASEAEEALRRHASSEFVKRGVPAAE